MAIRLLEKLNEILALEAAKVGNKDDRAELEQQLQQFETGQELVFWENVPFDNIEDDLAADSYGEIAPAMILNSSLTLRGQKELWERIKLNFFSRDYGGAWLGEMLARRTGSSWKNEEIQALWEHMLANRLDGYGSNFIGAVKFFLELPDLPGAKMEDLLAWANRGKNEEEKSQVCAGFLLCQKAGIREALVGGASWRKKSLEIKGKIYRDMVDWIFRAPHHLTQYGLDWSLMHIEDLKEAWNVKIITTTQMARALEELEEPARSEMVVYSAQAKIWNPIEYWLDDSPDLSGLSKEALGVLLNSPEKSWREMAIKQIGRQGQPGKKQIATGVETQKTKTKRKR